MPLPSKNSVRQAGQRATEAGRIDAISDDDLKVLEEWRKAHLKPLSAIAMWLRAPALEATGLPPAQRLKRRNTFLDKLITQRARDASTMHDIGGCRLMFANIQALETFRAYLERQSRARHKLSHSRDKFDYIANPKKTGYRGVHYVYSYQTSSSELQHLNGLKVELQLRTSVQHAWATSVEIADLISDTRTKFEDGSGNYGEFFRLASELLARKHEGLTSCLPELADADLVGRFRNLESRLQLLDRLGRLREQGDVEKIKQHTVLAFREDDTLEIFGYTKADRAVQKEQELQNDPLCANVVYVSASSPAAIRNSYRNYLTNPADFVALVHRTLE